MGDLDGIGDAVTGAMLARAVEPQAGEAGDGHTHEKNCLNCGARLSGAYCHVCGQKAHVHRSLRAFMGDFVAGVLNFEGKFWHTLPMLVWRPGEMTRRYIAGERARFISPVALYLFTVFAMFATLNFAGTLNPNHPTNFKQGLQQDIRENQAKIVKLEAERKIEAAAGKNVTDLDRRIAKRKEDITDSQNLLTGNVVQIDENDSLPNWIEPFVDNARQNPELVTAKVQDAASKYSWLLIPISVPFLWLLFPFSRRFKLYDHSVFVTYSLSFMMLLAIVLTLVSKVGIPGVGLAAVLVPPFHMYRQLKGAYGLSRWSSIWRWVLLLTFAAIAFSLFAVAVVLVGISD